MSFDNIKDFESLYECLKKNLLPIHGVGKLYIYDAALRLGAYFRQYSVFIKIAFKTAK